MTSKTVCITGASKGIGAAIARRMAKEGHRLILNTGSDESGLNNLSRELTDTYGISIFPSVGDIGNPDYVSSFIKEGCAKLGDVDILINNAGIAHVGLLSDMSVEQWQRVMNTNLNAAFYTSHAVLPGMVHRKSGKIINITSMWGEVGASCEVAYSAAKGGLITFTKALAKELAPSSIQVNALSCGVIDTRMNNCFSAEEKADLALEIPMERFGTPEEVADAVYNLLTMPDYLTGQILRIDGGFI